MIVAFLAASVRDDYSGGDGWTRLPVLDIATVCDVERTTVWRGIKRLAAMGVIDTQVSQDRCDKGPRKDRLCLLRWNLQALKSEFFDGQETTVWLAMIQASNDKNRSRREVWEHVEDRMRALVAKALDRIDHDLDNGGTSDMALALLKTLGRPDIVPRGQTSAAQIESSQKLLDLLSSF